MLGRVWTVNCVCIPRGCVWVGSSAFLFHQDCVLDTLLKDRSASQNVYGSIRGSAHELRLCKLNHTNAFAVTLRDRCGPERCPLGDLEASHPSADNPDYEVFNCPRPPSPDAGQCHVFAKPIGVQTRARGPFAARYPFSADRDMSSALKKKYRLQMTFG